MVKFLINRPIAVIMVFVALVLLGFIATKKIPISPLPDVDIPEITVQVRHKNISAQELENTVIKGLRIQLLQVGNIDDIHTETREGYSIIHLRFNYGTDINYAFIEVNEKIDLSMKDFPREMERPRVIKSSVSDLPVFYINLTLKDTSDHINALSRFIQLGEFAEQVIKRRLEQIPEIALVDITGVTYPEVYVIPNQAALMALNLKEEDFKQIIENNNLSFGNVFANDGQLQYNIRFSSSNLSSVEDVKNIVFKQNNRLFKLKDIATIGVRQQHLKGSFSANNQSAINLAVIKQSSANMDDLRKKVKGLLTGFEKQYGHIKFQQTQDETEILESSIRNLKQDLFLGIFLAFCLMFFFLKNLRSPLLIGITVPVSLVLSILFFQLIHLTINIISLSGLVLGVGLMIDNSIIVIDNISQLRERGATLTEACIRGTNEIIRPLISSVLTTCSVFLPLIYMSGISGALFYDQAMAVTIGVCISLIVSITLLPTLYKIVHRKKENKKETDFFKKYGIHIFERMYEAGFHWVFKYRMASIIIVVSLIVTNVFIFNSLKKERLPHFEQTELIAKIDWNQNIHVDENKKRIVSLVNLINKDLVQFNCMIGEQQYLLNREKELSSSEAQLYLKISNSASLNKVKDAIRTNLKKKYPDASLELEPPKNIFEKVFGDNVAFLEAHIVSKNNKQLPAIEKVYNLSQKINKEFPGASITPVAQQSTIAIKLDAEKLMLYDLSMEAVYQNLRSGLNSLEIGDLKNGNKFVPIMLSGTPKYISEVLDNTMVINKKGIAIPVKDFISVSEEYTYKTIQGGKEGNYIPLAMQVDNPEKVIEKINSLIQSDPNLDVSFSGSYFSNKKLVKEMAIVLAVAVLLLYFILSAQFESLIQPLIVLTELPISMSGALIMLYVFGSSINLISLIGLVVICGIIINDSILKLDTINHLRKEGYELMDAIHTAGKRRLKSIIMTSLTTMLSVAPFMFGNDMGSVLQRPLSLTIIGGMSLGTLVSLYFIPLVYWYYYRNEKVKKIVLPIMVNKEHDLTN